MQNRYDWRCSDGYGSDQCCIGLWRKHFNNVVSGQPQDAVTVGSYGPHPPEARLFATQIRHQDQEDVDSDAENDPLLDENDMYEVLLQDYNEDGHRTSDELDVIEHRRDLHHCPMTTSVVNKPKFSAESSSFTAGHYYLNSHLSVMARTGIMQKPPMRTLELLQNICSKEQYGVASLIYPEAMLFPRIFWSSIGESVIGAIPSVMYSNITDDISMKNVASLKQ